METFERYLNARTPGNRSRHQRVPANGRLEPRCTAHAEAKRGRSVSGPSCLDFPYVQLNIRVARASLFVQSTRGLGGFRVAPRFRVARRRGGPRGWRGRRRRGATPSGVEPRWRRPRQTRVRDSAPSRAFARKNQNGTPQLPLISVPRSGFQKIGISLRSAGTIFSALVA